MSLTPIQVVPVYEAAQYDGTNGLDFVGWATGMDNVVDHGTHLTFTYDHGNYSVPADGWLLRRNGSLAGTFSDTVFQQIWAEL